MSESDLRGDWPASALQAADKAFAALTVAPAPLTLDCAALTTASIAASGTPAGTAASGIAASGTQPPALPNPALPRPAQTADTADTADTAGPGATAVTGTAGDGGTTAGTAVAVGAEASAGSARTSALSGADLDLPAGEVPLPALRDWLMAHPSAYAVRDAVWRELIRRARHGEPEWVIAAVGMAMPALVAMAGTLAAGYRGDPADIDAEILTGFLEGLRTTVDPAQDAPHASLCFAAWRAGREQRMTQQEHLPVADIEHAAAESRLPRPPYGHVDLLVYRAEALGLIDVEDVEPYIDIRLGRRIPSQLVAAKLGIDHDTLRMRLNRADTRLAWALATGILTGTSSPEARDELAQRQQQRVAIRAGKAAAARRGGRRPKPSPAAAAA
jgi:hypothetical protein